MQKDNLLQKIETFFPFLNIRPDPEKILFDNDDAVRLDGLVRDILDEVKGDNVTADNIRLIHQDLSNLSAEFWYWIMPHYLRYCLTPEAEYQQVEIQFLIYALSPAQEFEVDTSKKLVLFNNEQLFCLIDFLEFLLAQDYFNGSYMERITRGKQFLSGVIKNE